MPRSRRLAVLGSLLGLVLIGPAVPAGAATTVVSVTNFRFTPATVTTAMGNSITWRFSSMHTSTSNQLFWDSGHRSSGDYVVTFRDAGTFGYFCRMHPSMKGSVRIPLRATGRPAAGWTLRWSTRSVTPANRRYDVQFRRAGTTTWTSFRSVTSARTAFFNPARSAYYQVRARTRNVGVGPSGWSPIRTVRIT